MSVKILIIDDEYTIVDGLSSFPWEEYGCEVVGTSQNGQEGLELLESLNPDLVFTDIRMPKMDGLTFAAEAKKSNPHLRIVFLTGYDSFEYVQEAIRVGGSDYLLKPVNFRKLDELVRRLCEEIRKENEVQSYYRDLQKTFEAELPYIRTKLISDLLQGRIGTSAELNERIRAVGVKIEKYVCIAITRENAHSGEENNWMEQLAFLNIGEEIFGEFSSEVLGEYDDLNLKFGFVLLFPQDMSSMDCMRRSVEASEKLKTVAEKLIRYKLCIGISDVETAAEDISKAYREACTACSQSIYLGENTIVQYRDLDAVTSRNISISEGKKQRLFMKIYSGQLVEVCEELEKIFQVEESDLAACKYMALDLLVSCLQYPFLCRVKCEIQEREYDYSFLQNGIKVISNAKTIDEIVQYLSKGFSLLATQNNKDTEDRYQHIVNDMISYVGTHYMENLTLDMLADYFHMSRTYVSRLLKRYTNQSFLKILVDVRMEKACQMIMEDQYKVYEIAQKVGYNDFSYFIQAFKKKFGVTPNEYRQTGYHSLKNDSPSSH